MISACSTVLSINDTLTSYVPLVYCSGASVIGEPRWCAKVWGGAQQKWLLAAENNSRLAGGCSAQQFSPSIEASVVPAEARSFNDVPLVVHVLIRE